MPEVNPEVYAMLNEGLGGAYERIAYSRMIKRFAQERQAKSILELDATYIAGLPGFNSCLLAADGYDVTVTINPRDYPDAVRAWKMLGLYPGPKENVTLLEDDGSLQLPNKAFDIVWNHLAFEHYPDPTELTGRMKNLSRDMVINLTLAPYNVGYIIHWINHKWKSKRWDHGKMSQMTIGAMRKAHQAVGLTEVESDACDVPPWIDTVDGKLGGSMTYLDGYPSWIKDRWVWCSADPKTEDKFFVKWFWHMEQNLPRWFKILSGHHLYVASTVKE